MENFRVQCLVMDTAKTLAGRARVMIVAGMLALTLMGLASNGAVAASFDCARARTPAEQAICQDPELSRLDSEVDAAYRFLLKNCAEPPPATLRAAQRRWLAGNDPVSVLLERYRQRSAELGALAAKCRQQRIGVPVEERASADKRAPFVVRTLSDEKLGYSLPFVESTPQTIGDKINEQVFQQLFELPAPPSLTDGLSSLRHLEIPENGLRSVASVSYAVIRNDGILLALEFEIEGCGAYCESYTDQKLFDSRSGNPVVATDLFTPAGAAAVGRQLKAARLQRGKQTLTKARLAGSLQDGELGTYRRCLAEWGQWPPDLWPLRLQADGSVRFVASRCSAHVNRPEDVLDDLDEVVPAASLRPYLSAHGRLLLRLWYTPQLWPICAEIPNGSLF